MTQVAVANCVTSYLGNGFRAQQGKVEENGSAVFVQHLNTGLLAFLSGEQDRLSGQGDSPVGGRK